MAGDKEPTATTPSPLHPAVTVSNIKNFIPIRLEMDNSVYITWSTLFTIHCKAFDCYDHLLPKKDGTASSSSSDPVWPRVDALVLQWIYSTISPEILGTIINPEASAADAWASLKGVFNNNKHTRAVHLQHTFSNTRLETFPNISAYCTALKALADQLANVGAPVSNDTLVLQLITGLTEQYDGVAMLLQQTEPLPAFFEARSKLLLEESRKAKQAAQAASSSDAALLATKPRPNGSSPPSDVAKPEPRNFTDPRSYDTRNQRGRNRNQGRNRGRQNSGRGRGAPTLPPSLWNVIQNWAQSQYPTWSPLANYNTWPSPPSPFPTGPDRRQPNPSAGILGPRPVAPPSKF
ncbi:hypothetical protein SSX86_029708 [Deinandra increscens subsp. villosa]|uniref:Gag protein n=1 Tax=Deinandra increscens subsp. villosa TaxID=3103831 RepID=A0AAP0CGT0_9ASTR